jgi:pilus assembly protein FimV
MSFKSILLNVFLASIRILILATIPLHSSNAAEQIEAQKYGPIKSGQTLWEIATKMRSGKGLSGIDFADKSITVEQLIAAIYKVNPDAFSSANMNVLLEGSYLTIPDAETILSTSSIEAKKQLMQHVHALDVLRVDAKQLKKAKILLKKQKLKTRTLQKQLARYPHKSKQWNKTYKKYVNSKRAESKSRRRITKLSALLLEKATLKPIKLVTKAAPKAEMSEVNNRLGQIQSSLENLNQSNNKLVEQVQQLATLDQRVKVLEEELGKNDELVLQLKNTLDAVQKSIEQQRIESKNLDQRLQELAKANKTASIKESQTQKIDETDSSSDFIGEVNNQQNNKENNEESINKNSDESTDENSTVTASIEHADDLTPKSNNINDTDAEVNSEVVTKDSVKPAENRTETAEKFQEISTTKELAPTDKIATENSPEVATVKVTEKLVSNPEEVINEPSAPLSSKANTEIVSKEAAKPVDPETTSTVEELSITEAVIPSAELIPENIKAETAINETTEKTEIPGFSGETLVDETPKKNDIEPLNKEQNKSELLISVASSSAKTLTPDKETTNAVSIKNNPEISQTDLIDGIDTYSHYALDSETEFLSTGIDSESNFTKATTVKSSFNPKQSESGVSKNSNKNDMTSKLQVVGRNTQEQENTVNLASNHQTNIKQDVDSTSFEHRLWQLIKNNIFIIASILNGLMLIFVLYSFFSKKQIIAEIKDSDSNSASIKQKSREYISWQDREKPKRSQ